MFNQWIPSGERVSNHAKGGVRRDSIRLVAFKQRDGLALKERAHRRVEGFIRAADLEPPLPGDESETGHEGAPDTRNMNDVCQPAF